MAAQAQTQWLYPNGSLSRGPWNAVVDASLPGWQHTALRVATLKPGETLELEAGDIERMIVPLEGGTISVVYREGTGSEGAGEDGQHELASRPSVFAGPADTAYYGSGVSLRISGEGRVAVAEAAATQALGVEVLRKSNSPVELRGAGASTRQVHNFGVPGGLRGEKLIVCEVITPSGNWSSYPPHKHDEDHPGVESRLEEIYYFEADVARGVDVPARGTRPFGTFHTHSSPGHEISIAGSVQTGDIALVPWGYHGPAAAAPGYDLYYLNVMAGPSTERVWHIQDDPEHAWVREVWKSEHPDPRLPFTNVEH